MSSLGAMLLTVLGMIQLTMKVSGSQVDLTVKPGDNVTLYCDMKWVYGKHTYWYRNCSHYRQPSFVISTNEFRTDQDFGNDNKLLSSYGSEWNSTSRSHDLLIKNITESELGVYYCSVAEIKVIYETVIQQKLLHSFGNITYKLFFGAPEPTCPPSPDCGQYRILLVSLCPFSALVSALMAFLCMQVLSNKTGSFQEHDRQKGGGFQVGVSLPHLLLGHLKNVGDVYTEVTYKRL